MSMNRFNVICACCSLDKEAPFRMKFQQQFGKSIVREFGADGKKLMGMKPKQFQKARHLPCYLVLARTHTLAHL